MSSVIKEMIGLGSMFVVAWVVIFGMVGAILARNRGGSLPEGLLLGAFLGPVGWALTWLRTDEAPESALEDLDGDYDGWEAL